MKKNRACICFSFEKLARILNLRPELSIVSAKVDPADETLTLYLEGGSLPARERRDQAQRIPIAELMDVDE